MDTPCIFITAELPICKPGSSSVLILISDNKNNKIHVVSAKYKLYNFIEISSWEVVTYGIYARVDLFSQTNEREQRASEFCETD